MRKKIIPVLDTFSANANISLKEYQRLYRQSIQQPDIFWADMATRLEWFHPFDSVLVDHFKDAKTSWFTGGKLNACYNCVDRHVKTPLRDKAALIWQGEDPKHTRTYTYSELHQAVCQAAAVLQQQGVRKGDRVLLYLPMIPELAIITLACARIGAVHTIVFGGFSAAAVADRIDRSKPTLAITADGGWRAGKIIPLKASFDKALTTAKHTVNTVLVVKNIGPQADITWKKKINQWWHELLPQTHAEVPCEAMDAEDPLFILFTSGSTGKPKGVLHTTAGYLLGAHISFYYIFDHKPDDIYWCTADLGWITGHSYTLYGPLSNGATTLMFEGVPTYPDASRFWQIIDYHQVTVFYTAPTAIRALSAQPLSFVEKCSLQSLRLLGSVGEPINPEAWWWYFDHIGKQRCPIVDTWWQTETGSIMISPLPGATPLKPGSATRPFFGVKPAILDDKGKTVKANTMGNLCITAPWPSLMRGVFGEPERFKTTYFSQIPGVYFTGDQASVDNDGDYWIAGRSDDVINVSGHRIGSAEVESALVSHPAVAEAAIVAVPHDIKGQALYAFVILNEGKQWSEALQTELLTQIDNEIGKIARPDYFQAAPELPKTRSGKIMRRILRKIAEGDINDLGDTSTLADPSIIEKLVADRKLSTP